MDYELHNKPFFFKNAQQPSSMVIYANHDGWGDNPLCQDDPIGEIYGREPEEMLYYTKLFIVSPELLKTLKEIVKSYDSHTDGFARQVLRPHAERARAMIDAVEENKP